MERIATGGMGAVYRASHRATGTDVAVKVVRGNPDARAVRRFRREVEAHAGLLHPGIVQLVDYGNIPDSAAAASDGMLSAGSPYVVMELANGGTVRSLHPTSWLQLHQILRQVLEGLGHAHARGVIHRDLKPDNLLVFERDGEFQVKLTDFGIAHALSAIEQRGTTSLGAVIGTPKYMAPEQLLGQWRDHGPWTDIYAVGCIAFELASGAPPYAGKIGIEEALAHLREPPPPLVPLFPVPEGFPKWLRMAMATTAAARYQRAREALETLPSVDAATVDAPTRATPLQVSDTVTQYPAPLATTAETVPLSDRSTEPVDRATTQPMDVPTAATAVEPEYSAAPVVGAGMGLIGLRNPAFIGRRREREVIWNAFVETVQDDRLHVILVEGEAGIGKSRIAQWATSRAHEVGSARVLRLDDFAASTRGLEDALHTWRMPRDQVYGRLMQTLPSFGPEDTSRERDARALTELLRPSDGAEVAGPRYSFSSSLERILVLVRLFRRLAIQRPTLVWIDDLQWAGPSIDLVEHLLSIAEPPGVLLLATVRSDVVASRPELRGRFEKMAQSPVVTRIELGPLPESEAREFAEQVPVLTEEGAAELVERMHGSPLFGTLLLTDWVERLRSPARDVEDLPTDVHAAWIGRARRLEREMDDPGQFRRSVQLAAVLGRSVSADEWGAVCAGSADVTADIWSHLVLRGLAKSTRDGWHFVHGSLVESVVSETREAGQLDEVNRVCAEALQTLFDRGETAVAGRLATHWVAAGEPARALSPMAEQVERLVRFGDDFGARELLSRQLRLLDEVGVAKAHPNRVRAEFELARCDYRAGADTESLVARLLELAARIDEQEERELASTIHSFVASCLVKVGDLEGAWHHGSLARDAARSGGAARVGETLLRLWSIEHTLRHLDAARDVAREILELGEETSDNYLRAIGHELLGWTETAVGDLVAAEQWFSGGRDLARHEGYYALQGDCENGLGDVARMRSDHDAAIEHYGAARAVYREIGWGDDQAVAEINQGLAEVGAGNWAHASELFAAAETQYEGRSVPAMDATIAGGRLAIAAGRGDWKAFDAWAEWLREFPAGAGAFDCAWAAGLAADAAARAGEEARESTARELVERFSSDET